jgi:flagellar biosynthesis protein FlhG
MKCDCQTIGDRFSRFPAAADTISQLRTNVKTQAYVSSMGDQADNLRLLVERKPQVETHDFAQPPLIAITGGRTGVGVTTVAVNLAAVLADCGKQVLLLDAAQQQPNIVAAAGVRLRGNDRHLLDVVNGDCPIADALIPGPAGMLLLAACSRGCVSRQRESRRTSSSWSRQAQQRLMTGLRSLHGTIDLIVADIGSGLTPWTRRFWLRAQLVIVVTTTEAPSILDSYAIIKRSVADVLGPDLRVLVNRSDNSRAAATQERLANACQRFLQLHVPAVPSLPSHRELDSCEAMTPPRVWEAPNTPFGHAVLWLGRAVSDALERSSISLRARISGYSSGVARARAANY